MSARRHDITMIDMMFWVEVCSLVRYLASHRTESDVIVSIVSVIQSRIETHIEKYTKLQVNESSLRGWCVQ